MTIPRPDPMNAIEPTDLGSFQVINDWLTQVFWIKIIDMNNDQWYLKSNFLSLIYLFQVEMTCLYKGGKGSSCPKTVYRAKTAFQNSAIRHGERLTQYYNTPSCDKKTNFKNRYLDYALNFVKIIFW